MNAMATMKCQRFLLLVLVLFAPRAVIADVAALVRKAEEATDPHTKLGYLNQALREDDSHWAVWALRADAHRMLEQYDKAESDATEAIGRGRGEKDAWRVRALVRLVNNDSDGAIRDAGEALRLGDKTVMVHVIRGEAYLSKGDLQAAVRDADSAIAIDERASSAYRLRALAYERLGNESGALVDLNKAVRVDNQNVDTLIQRIAFHIRTKRFKYALSDCEYGEQIAPGSEAVKSLRIEALRKSGQVDEAVRVARAETTSQPRSSLLLHQLALACYDAKTWQDVIEAANDLVAIVPDHLG
ncbi:MAG: tetratricopeptide repeat protein, partial [Planctomycetes bacterium]|nr:tetratricopeptide repeat protein [Planctomycetota bacterium]